jgi:succinyl-CoA synthetase beta subunit
VGPGTSYVPRLLNPGAADVLTETDSKNLLRQYGVQVPEGGRVEDVQQAKELAARLGGAVAIKSESRLVLHRAAKGGLRLNVVGAEAVARACDEVMAAALAAGDTIGFKRLRVEAMTRDGGLELLVGARRDPVLGSCIVVGKGGSDAEAAEDVCARLAPLEVNDAKQMLAELRMWPTLSRQLASPAALDRLAASLVSISHLIRDLGSRLSEMDVNPLLVKPDGDAIALDALIVLRSQKQGAVK